MCRQMKFLTSLGTLSLIHKSKKHIIQKMFPTTTTAHGPAGEEGHRSLQYDAVIAITGL